MKFRFKKPFGVLTMTLLASLWLGRCSSQSQQEEDVTASEEVTDENSVNENVAAAEGEVEGEEGALQEEATSEETFSGTNQPQNQTESNLKEIISEMNSNNAVAAGDPEATATEVATTATPADAAPAPAPTAEAAPAANVQPAGLPELGSKMAYVVQPGDTLGKIATKIYGDQTKWKDISSLSSLVNPSRIYPGDVVYYALDEVTAKFASTYESTPKAQEVVQQGDTLAKIAQRVYGTSTNWKHIWRHNDQIENPDQLTPGSVVYYVAKTNFTAAKSGKSNHVAKKGFANKTIVALN